MEQQPVTSKQYFTSLKIIHGALIAGIVMFSVVSFFINPDYNGVHEMNQEQNILFIVIGSLAFAGIFIGDMVSRKNIENARNEKPLIQKMAKYQTSKIIKYAMLEAPALMGPVFFILTGNIYFLFITLFIVLLMAISYPSKERAIEELKLSSEEIQLVQKSTAIISEIKTK